MKRGFTLIELLAVIVILSIIALIAVPIVINIIDDSKKSSSLRSAEFYLASVENAVATSVLKNKSIKNEIYDILENGNVCLSYDTNNKCTEELEVEVNGETPKDGTVTIQDGEISYADMQFRNDRLIQNNEGIVTNFPCKLISGDKETLGSKYECEVKPGTTYNFYVLSSEEDGTTNLILDRNVYYDSTTKISGLTDENHLGKVAWVSKEDYGCDSNDKVRNDKGPITAMNYLYNATKTWVNIPLLNYSYDDKYSSNQSRPLYTFVSTYGVGILSAYNKEGIFIGTKEKPLFARMPTYNEVQGSKKCLTWVQNGNKHGSCPLYLVNYLSSSDYVKGEGLQNIKKLYGYWTLSSSYSNTAYSVEYLGDIAPGYNVYGNSAHGVRPVINIKL